MSAVISPRVRPDHAEIVEVGEGFLARTFPPSRYHHREHLIMATYLLVRYPERDWRAELPDLIRRYNVASGGVNDDTRGYHHTMTMAFLTLVEGVLAGVGHEDVVSACNAVLTSVAAERNVLLRFWSRELLFSRDARLGWVEPDIGAIDPHTIDTPAIGAS
ncbi:hypothetical protein SAMN02745126_00476 [Enhydrobacter aerosaccus]|uniref:Uncharacterized protein n=1 Tax=Enhydrobacter aerosaccus TaxID=225324 RepID=A0A1T4JUD0_9HYPH|nr:hypothetical protein [Enhydrobacter aerosaccus]SJZ33776.1 hypothetical protein SAMN02745126_00476 [Enhydrobacter aerosaccus]